MLDEGSFNEDYTHWRNERFFKFADDLKASHLKWNELKKSCLSCKSGVIKSLDRTVLQDMMKYISRFKIKDVTDFSMIFWSAFIYGVTRFNVSIPVRNAKMDLDRWDMLSDNEQRNWKPRLYDIDTGYQKLINTVAGAMIDCLSESP